MDVEVDAVIELGRRAAACQKWAWRVGMSALAKDKSLLILQNCELPIEGDAVVRLVSHVFSEAQYAFGEDDALRIANEKAYATMITGDDDDWATWAVGLVYLNTLIPDFYDTVTARGLLQVVRAAWDAPTLSTNYSEYADGRCVWSLSLPMLQSEGSGFTMRSHILIESDTEIGVLVAALEKAP